MPAERKKHLAKEISTPDARGLKGCRKRLLQPNQPKKACRNLFFAVEESLFSKFFLYTVCCGYKLCRTEILLLRQRESIAVQTQVESVIADFSGVETSLCTSIGKRRRLNQDSVHRSGGESETKISLPRVQKPPFAAASDLCGRRCSIFSGVEISFQELIQKHYILVLGIN